MAELPSHITEQIRKIVEARDLILLDLVKRGQTNSTVVEIIVDNEIGVNLDVLAEISREIGQTLDEKEDVINGRYRLEVSTPGLDRPLEHDWQFRKSRGRLVKVSYQEENESLTSGLFRLLEFQNGNFTLEPFKPGKGKSKGAKKDLTREPVLLPLDRVQRIVVEPEL